MAKTAQQLRADMRTMAIARTTSELADDLKLGSRLAGRAATVDERAGWVVALGVLETELNQRGVPTCELCGWPNGEHDPYFCPTTALTEKTGDTE